ncbi:hypothetical protein FQR65_LT18083 [Abscondita terminalis]|nr:hypothetical protein FQR65_LT18083 [Abscondita terminalis]
MIWNAQDNPHKAITEKPKLYSLKALNYFRMGIVLYLDVTDNIQQIIPGIKETWLVKNNLDANVKWIIITSRSSVADYFLYLWSLGLNNFVVLINKVDKRNMYQQLYTGDPQVISNNCGKAFNSFIEQSCDSDIVIEFPKPLRKYSNCIISYLSDFILQDSTQLGYVTTEFLMNQITLHLNTSWVHYKSSLKTIHEVYSRVLRSVRFQNPSPIYFSPKVIWAVPKPNKIPLVEVLKIIFKKTVWALITFSFLFVSIVWWFILKYTNNGAEYQCDFALSLLNVWELTILGCLNKVPMLWALRFILIGYIAYSIHIQTIISSKIVEILTIPQYEQGIQNLEQLVTSNLQVIISEDVSMMLFQHHYANDHHRYDKIFELLLEIKDNKFVETFF